MQMDGSRQLSKCELEPVSKHAERNVSPVKVYFVKTPEAIVGKEQGCDEKGICRMQVTFTRQQEEPGEARLLMADMLGESFIVEIPLVLNVNACTLRPIMMILLRKCLW